jgi:hypothetical protein
MDDRNGGTWRGLDTALRRRRRGLTGGSLSKLLDKHIGPRPVAGRAALTVETILAWADRHKERTGAYPHAKSGPVQGAPGEAWHPSEAPCGGATTGCPATTPSHRSCAATSGESPGAGGRAGLTTHRGVEQSCLPDTRAKEASTWARRPTFGHSRAGHSPAYRGRPAGPAGCRPPP